MKKLFVIILVSSVWLEVKTCRACEGVEMCYVLCIERIVTQCINLFYLCVYFCSDIVTMKIWYLNHTEKSTE